jgi:hypothetical protein
MLGGVPVFVTVQGITGEGASVVAARLHIRLHGVEVANDINNETVVAPRPIIPRLFPVFVVAAMRLATLTSKQLVSTR